MSDVLRRESVSESRTDMSCSRVFTTEPKLRRVIWHKQLTVRTRATVLQESFYPTADVPYNAVKQRMAALLGIVDDQSVLAYLGRPETVSRNNVGQIVRYESGATVNKRHTFIRLLPVKKGYIEVFGLGYVYVKNDEWWIHWNHDVQAVLSVSDRAKNTLVSLPE